MRVFTGAIATISLCGANIGMSHHSPASVYVMSETIQIDGIVTDFRYNNPHMRIFIDVTNEDGETESWIAEGGTPNILLRNGWSPETLKPGDRIHVNGNPAREQDSLFIHLDIVTLPDGSELFGEDVQIDEAAERRRSRRR